MQRFFYYGNVKFFSSMGKMKTFDRDHIFDDYIKKNGLPGVLRVYRRLYSFIPILNFLNCLLRDKNPYPFFRDSTRVERFCEYLLKFKNPEALK